MSSTKHRQLTDAHGDEVLYLHKDVLDSDLTASGKIMVAVLRKLAFATGEVTVHYPKLATLARMPLSSVKNRGGVMDRLRGKGWIRGKVSDGGSIRVRMSPGWRSKSGEPSDFDVAAGTAEESVVDGTGTVPSGTETVPHPVPERYCPSTETVPPSENKEGSEGIGDIRGSEAPVTLTGSGSRKTGASPSIKAGEAKTVSSAPMLSPELALALRAEARLWTEQVADVLGMNMRAAWGVDVRLPQPEGRDPVWIAKNKPEGSEPWPGDIETVFAYAKKWYPDADPVQAFRAVIREPARYTSKRQHILGHALRMQASQKYKKPRIKLCSLFRLDNMGKDVPESMKELACCDVGYGNLLERAHELAYAPPAPCRCPPDPDKEVELRRLADPNNRFTAGCWDGCWQTASARFASAKVPKWAYWAYLRNFSFVSSGYEAPPLPWILDSLDIEHLESAYAGHEECRLEFCDNWGAVVSGCEGADGSVAGVCAGADAVNPLPIAHRQAPDDANGTGLERSDADVAN